MVTRRYTAILVSGISILSLFVGLVASEFIEKREKKNISINTLKEECCEQCGELLKQMPRLLHMTARLQTEALTVIEGYWRGDKQSWCAQASRQKLQSCRDRLTLLQKKIEMVVTEGEQVLKEMHG